MQVRIFKISFYLWVHFEGYSRKIFTFGNFGFRCSCGCKGFFGTRQPSVRMDVGNLFQICGWSVFCQYGGQCHSFRNSLSSNLWIFWCRILISSVQRRVSEKWDFVWWPFIQFISFYCSSLPWDQETPIGYFFEICVDNLFGEAYIFSASFILLFVSMCLHHQAFYQVFTHSLLECNRPNANYENKLLLHRLIRFHITAKEYVLLP